MKKKILSIALAVVILAIASIGTLAYFTETTPKTDNVFTVGNIHIGLDENFVNNQVLLPGSPVVTKQVKVTNKGLNDAYVRVHIAIPSALDNPIDGNLNTLMFTAYNTDLGQWNWSRGVRTSGGFPAASNWNMYVTQIGNINYNVYVVTYETKLSATQFTPFAMENAYLNPALTQTQADTLKTTLGNDWHMYVVAEAVQAAGFSDAFSAFAASFKTIGSYSPFETAT